MNLQRFRPSIFCLLGALVCAPVIAQSYPDRAVTVMVPFGAGSTPDLTARYFASELNKRWGQSFIVENRPGFPAVRAVKAAAPDGYTLLWDSGAATIRQVLTKNADVDVRNDFTPIAPVLSGALGLFVNPASPFHSIGDVIAFAKKNPGKMNYGSGGIGTTLHLYMELFKQRTGIDLVHIPYKGGPPAATALLRDDIQFLMFDIPGLVAQGRDKYRFLAVTKKTRSPFYPDVPTVKESGGPEFDAGFWIGLLAPAQTPAPIVSRLSLALKDILSAPNTTEYLKKFSYESAWTPPEDFRRLISEEITQWTDIVRTARIPQE